jgi:hypothetical protein
MELFDIVADSRRLDDVTDLLGGSALLGLAVTIPIAALVALTVRYIARLVMNSHRGLVAAIGRFIALLARVHLRVHHALTLAVLFGISIGACALGDESVAFAAAPDARSIGNVAGSVTTSDDVPIGNAVVTLQGEGTSQSGHTDGAGRFSIPNLLAGTYAIRVSALGFDPLGPRPIGVGNLATTDVALALVRSFIVAGHNRPDRVEWRRGGLHVFGAGHDDQPANVRG